MGSSSATITGLKALFGALAFLGFIWLLLLGILEAGRPDQRSFKDMEMAAGKKLGVHQLDLNNMSKRRVPNGPDPIHNRRAGNSHRPPGHA
ncbi:CLAVATA3/ESR (CLE)-related protein 25-like [Diospyros lotus]|uniref:CLAVATA3/ESR (CLE)-related protein 25-like n=1 Tax=Diospyros lotus TaxID=55363 RepID=UPI002259AD0E|nr:CLAVATA3/ESR (CLE)-related protein 25-like [Diospyros lotus]XP_052186525.1 CLAVATA3/ESR (CLE)-related protein 25-like [Diospyros lotus]